MTAACVSGKAICCKYWHLWIVFDFLFLNEIYKLYSINFKVLIATSSLVQTRQWPYI